jgi:hypothetical protein
VKVLGTQYVNGEAQITWDDGAKDAIRKVGSKYQKYAYSADKSFSDPPDNVTSAQNTNPKPSYFDPNPNPRNLGPLSAK